MTFPSIDNSLSEELLDRLSWQHALLPDGTVAARPCFEFSPRPDIITISDKPISDSFLTSSDWTNNLIKSGVNLLKNDDPTKRVLAENWNLLHRFSQKKKVHNLLSYRRFHLIYLETRALINISRIQGPTPEFKAALEDAVLDWEKDPPHAWEKLCTVWDTFGFLWPRKIRLGYQHREECHYTYQNNDMRALALRQAEDRAATDLFHHLQQRMAQKRTHVVASDGDTESIHSRLSHFYSDRFAQPDELSSEEVLSWTIITRDELRPVYELLPDEQLKNTVKAILRYTMAPIPVHQPVKLRSVANCGYLCWKPADQPKENNDTVASSETSIGTLPIAAMDTPQSQYLWNFSWAGYPDKTTHPLSGLDLSEAPESYESLEVRCEREVYLHPSCKTPSTNSVSLLDSQATFLAKYWDTELKDQGRQVLGVKLADHGVKDMNTSSMSGTSTCDDEREQRWKIELLGLGYSIDDMISTDKGLNVDIMIGRKRQILHGDTIYLHNILYLCSTPNTLPTISKLKRSQSVPRRKAAGKLAVHAPLKPVLAKEGCLIDYPIEKSWVIELATEEDIISHPHYQPWPEPRKDMSRLNRMTKKRNSYCSSLSETASIHVSRIVNATPGVSSLRRTQSSASVADSRMQYDGLYSDTDSDSASYDFESASVNSSHRSSIVPPIVDQNCKPSHTNWEDEKKCFKDYLKRFDTKKSRLHGALSWDTFTRIFKKSSLMNMKCLFKRKNATPK